jgi:hypothetical protein
MTVRQYQILVQRSAINDKADVLETASGFRKRQLLDTVETNLDIEIQTPKRVRAIEEALSSDVEEVESDYVPPESPGTSEGFSDDDFWEDALGHISSQLDKLQPIELPSGIDIKNRLQSMATGTIMSERSVCSSNSLSCTMLTYI